MQLAERSGEGAVKWAYYTKMKEFMHGDVRVFPVVKVTTSNDQGVSIQAPALSATGNLENTGDDSDGFSEKNGVVAESGGQVCSKPVFSTKKGDVKPQRETAGKRQQDRVEKFFGIFGDYLEQKKTAINSVSLNSGGENRLDKVEGAIVDLRSEIRGFEPKMMSAFEAKLEKALERAIQASRSMPYSSTSFENQN